MKRVYSCDNVALAWHMRNVLEQYDIDAVVKNDKLYSVAGEVPITECQPEVWVKNSLDFKRAEELIREVESTPVVEEPDWYCSGCGERNGGNFDICWNCQKASGKLDA